jgi:predicted RNase H-like nuclease (RuvC/YqgF family)
MTKLSEEMQEEADAIVEYSDSGVDYAMSATLKKYIPKVKELEEEVGRLNAEKKELERKLANAEAAAYNRRQEQLHSMSTW